MGGGLESRCVGRVYGADGAVHDTIRSVHTTYAAAEACHKDTTPTSHTETPTHIETRTHNQCGDKIEKSQAPDDGCINVRNMLSIEEVK